MKKIIILILVAFSFPTFGQGFLHQSGQNVVNGSGQNVLLRGLGLGGWMVQEGYMLQTDAFAGPQHKIKEKIKQLIGEAKTEAFYDAYRANGITKRDIDSLKSWGFNSIRLPMHYDLYTLPIQEEPIAGQNTWLEEGFQMTDDLLSWCAQNQMYLILDLHAAPGGQGKDANISDYDATKPSLWESEANRQKTIALWTKLANRYKNNTWIGGYDLINEPNWNFTGTNQNGCDEGSNVPLRALQLAITQAIRTVDTNHMIIIEGNCWGNNYNGMFPLWDNNMMLSFHKYWNYNDTASIQGMLNYRTQYNVPIWMGEGGENSNVWFKDAISLLESNNIGWAFWPMKKIENIAGVTNVKKTPEYEVLLNYWKNGGTQPTEAFATAALMQMAENYKMQNVTVKPDVIDAMFRQIQSNETIAYKNHILPGKVFAVNYDLGQNQHAYYDKDVANYRTVTGNFEAWNKGYNMRNDGVDIQVCTDAVNNGFNVGFIDATEWLQYTINQNAVTAYDIEIRYASPSQTGKLYLEDANGRISEPIVLPSTGSYTTWGTATLTDVLLKAGTNKVKVYFETGNINFNYLEFKNPRTSAQIALKAIDASTTILGDKIRLTLNKAMQSGINFSQSNMKLYVNGNLVTISSISLNPANASELIIKPARAINASDILTISYEGTNILAIDSTVLPAFLNKPVKNNTGNILGISGKIQAEDFYSNFGLTLETTSDQGGSSAIAYTDSGDYADYLVNIDEAGEYKIEYRTAAQNDTGSVKLQLINDGNTTYQTVSLSPTGGWQNWATTSSQAILPAGRYILRILIENAGFNLNWIKFSIIHPDDDNDGVSNADDTCPDTPTNDVVNFNGCTIFSLASNNFTIKRRSESCRTSNNGSIEITAIANYPYLATISINGQALTNLFNSQTIFNNLQAGTYNVCITIPSISNYQNCYEVIITEPQDLSVLSRIIRESYEVKIDLSGGELYRIELNETTYMTDQNTITLPLLAGKNELFIKTNKDCQGIYKQTITLENKIVAYPNPAQDILHIKIPNQKNEQISTVQLYSLIGKLIIDKQFQASENIFTLDISELSIGTYALKVFSNTSIYNTKISKK